MKLYCPEDGGHVVKVRFQPTQGERYCPKLGRQLLSTDPNRPRKGLKRGGKVAKESSAETQARQRFKRIVCSRRCFFSDTTEAGEPRRPGHECVYPLDPHHLVDQRFIRSNFGDLPEEVFLEILHNPVIGAPLCRYNAHSGVESHVSAFIYWEELEDDCIQFCERIDDRYADVPLPSGTKRQSMLERLKEKCPEREAVA